MNGIDTPRDRTIRLSDGRRLGYAEIGNPAGRPLLYFHGFPGSRLEALLADAAARRQDVRLIGVDRPGYGLSDPKPGRALTDWPRDVDQLADRLGLTQFGVVGVSGGGPYALACAHAMPERLPAVAVLCGVGPFSEPEASADIPRLVRLGLGLYRRWPGCARAVLGIGAAAIRAWPEALVGRFASAGSAPDRRALADRAVRRVLARSFREAHRRGGAGAWSDVAVYARPWGFALEAVPVAVHLWHGGRDRIVPLSMGRFVARRLPRCRAEFLAEEGHFSLMLGRVEDVLGELAQRV